MSLKSSIPCIVRNRINSKLEISQPEHVSSSEKRLELRGRVLGPKSEVCTHIKQGCTNYMSECSFFKLKQLICLFKLVSYSRRSAPVSDQVEVCDEVHLHIESLFADLGEEG